MKKKISNKLLQCLSLVLLAGIWGGCTDEREPYESPGGGGTAQREVTFSVQVPGAGTPDTYALSATNENEVTEIAVLLFDAGGGYTYQPLWCHTITSSGTNGNTKEFTVKIPEGTYSMMVLANADLSLGAALGDLINPIAVGDSKTTVAGKVLQAISGTAKWIANSSDPAYKAIPMWGEIPTTTVNSSLTGTINISLVRMLAKINVTLTTAAAKASFKLKNVRLYNYNDRGQVAPNTSTWTGTPSVPASAQKPAVPINNPLLYTAMTTADVACAGEIYTFESNRGTSATHLNNTCLVVGGRYTGDAADSYYRIDFANTTSGVTTYLHLLRNHSYEVNITGVSSPGLPTPEDAFKSRAVKIQADILAWNDGAMSDVVSDGQHKLQVSQGAFTFTRETRTASSPDNVLSITTDVSSGWKVEKYIDATSGLPVTWVSLNPNNKNNAGSTNTDILLAENTSGSSRTAKIHINAGRLTYVVTVTQNTAAALMLTLRDAATNTMDVTDLVFASAAGVTPAQQSVKLSWMPVDKSVDVERFQVGSNPWFAYSGGDQLGSLLTSITDPSGAKSLTIQPSAFTPPANDPFQERISKIDFTVFNGTNYLSKSLFLRQFVYNMVPVVEDVYMMTGGQRSFAVRANAPFTVTLKTNPNNVVSNLSTSGAVNTTASGTPVYFDIFNDFPTPTLFQKEVVVTIKSVPEGLFPNTDVSLKCVSGQIQPKSNSYMVVPNGTPILIPVSRANESMLGAIQLGTNEAFYADLIWTDQPHSVYPVEGLGANGAVKSIQAVGTGASGYVLVIPGAGQGNAIVCIKNASNNRILWSWHIWVTSYNPYDANGNAVGIGTGNNWMDRNLGAVTNTPGLVTTKGLLYQWGRKDPFPGSSSINGNVESAIYSKTAQFAIVRLQVSSASNFVNSVGNPSTFYYSTSHPYDWFTAGGGGQNDALWGHGTGKTVYDPCPAGWRVPQNGVWNSLTTSNFPWNSTALGRTNASSGGFYPAQGMRYDIDGTQMHAGAGVGHWSAGISGRHAYAMAFTNTNLYQSNTYPRARGYGVRCVRE